MALRVNRPIIRARAGYSVLNLVFALCRLPSWLRYTVISASRSVAEARILVHASRIVNVSLWP